MTASKDNSIVSHSAPKGQKAKADPNKCQQEKMLEPAMVKKGQIFPETGVGIDIPAGPAGDPFSGDIKILSQDQAAQGMIVRCADDDPGLLGAA